MAPEETRTTSLPSPLRSLEHTDQLFDLGQVQFSSCLRVSQGRGNRSLLQFFFYLFKLLRFVASINVFCPLPSACLIIHQIHLLRQFVSSYQFFRNFKPSIAADVIPPAYPAPSPQGYKPFMELSNVSPLGMRTGEEVRLSTPAKIASGRSNPLIFLPKLSIPSTKASESSSGRTSLKFANWYSPQNAGRTSLKLFWRFFRL